ncbi:hypothetical protein KSP40_PGU013265 [Platanthera guangdongensis]|uniref:Phospholipase/carboxylesterase/thioesterase domain-containing protein n=1 Tax=Platanthera guangdongensis TaxID=2320717 RepID=A0ABR2N4I5_9ASPA
MHSASSPLSLSQLSITHLPLASYDDVARLLADEEFQKRHYPCWRGLSGKVCGVKSHERSSGLRRAARRRPRSPPAATKLVRTPDIISSMGTSTANDTRSSSWLLGHNAGGRSNRRAFEFGRTYVVKPKGRHQATVVWLHGLGDNGSSWSHLLEALPLHNIKWICPTAPTRSVAAFGGFPCTAWLDVGEFSEDGPDDIDGVDASAAHIANLMSAEPAGINISAVVGLSGWLPCSRSLKNKVESSQDSARKAASLPILLCHGKDDDVVLYKHGEKSVETLRASGFRNVSFKTYTGLGHHSVPEEMNDVCKWLTARLGLDGSR